ncbi:MAG TPA: hypothetical protein VGQ20_18510 [Acidimicrobiales bacterium]|jgi:hypothetical protein|nr:hypothetical protein [Acidimicrobiales bacterium]
MGQPVTVIEKPSYRSGVVRYEINRVLTGMGHEVYRSAPSAGSNRPVDVLARRLFARGGIRSIHVNGSVITIELADSGTDGIRSIIENLYTYYVPGVEPPSDEELLAEAPPA